MVGEMSRRLGPTNVVAAYTWLCKAADQGHNAAMVSVGQVNQYVNRDYVSAYVWYVLAGIWSTESLQNYSDSYLNAEEYQAATLAIQEWQPGKCHKEIVTSIGKVQ